ISDWNTVGLKATASQSFEIHNLIVNESQCFEINPARSRFDEPVFRYPFLQLAEVTLAANSSGMAVNFIDLAEGVIAERAARKKLKPEEAAVLTQAVSHAKNRMNTARADFYTALDRSWNILAAENAISAQVLNTVSRTSRELALTARQCVDELYPFCGLAAAVPQSDLNRVWRDIHTASQHSLLTFTKENS